MILTVVDQVKDYSRELWAIKRHLRIEVCALFFFLSSFLLMIGMSVFELEKACRVNLRLEAEICDNLNNIPYKEMCSMLEQHETALLARNGGNSSDHGLDKLLKMVQAKGHHVKDLSELVLVKEVCDAEKESQKLVSKLFAIRAPIGKWRSVGITTLADFDCLKVS